jgi:hypothetical protein
MKGQTQPSFNSDHTLQFLDFVIDKDESMDARRMTHSSTSSSPRARLQSNVSKYTTL